MYIKLKYKIIFVIFPNLYLKQLPYIKFENLNEFIPTYALHLPPCEVDSKVPNLSNLQQTDTAHFKCMILLYKYPPRIGTSGFTCHVIPK